MSVQQSSQQGPATYHIRVKGHFDDRWEAWFEGMTLTPEGDGNTLLSGQVVDQAALHGLLRKIRDLGLVLISVSRVNPGGDAPELTTPPE